MARSWEHDQAQPLFFLFGALTVIVCCWTAGVVCWLLFPGHREVARTFPPSSGGHAIRYCRTTAMASLRTAEEARLRSRCGAATLGFCFRMVVLASLWAWDASLFSQWRVAVAQNVLYDGFDPYKILKVAKGTDDASLKKAFRKEALKYHPDKNPGQLAATNFLLARKALDSLTDEESMENFKEFGNPDGPQHVTLYAFSSFILDKQASRVDGKKRFKPFMMRAVDLQLRAAVIGILFACLFFVWWAFDESPSDQSCLGDLSRKSRKAFEEGLKSDELRQALVKALGRKRDLLFAPHSTSLNVLLKDGNSRVSALLCAHSRRQHSCLESKVQRELSELLVRARRHLCAMMELAHGDQFLAAVKLHCCLVQALDMDDPYEWLQDPNHSGAPGALKNFLAQSVQNGGGIPTRPSGIERAEFASSVSVMAITAARIEDDDHLVAGQPATLRVSLRRTQLGQDEAAGYAHAPFFPRPVADVWWVMFEGVKCRVVSPLRDVQMELDFVPQTGRTQSTIHVVSEAYVGLDVKKALVFSAHSA